MRRHTLKRPGLEQCALTERALRKREFNRPAPKGHVVRRHTLIRHGLERWVFRRHALKRRAFNRPAPKGHVVGARMKGLGWKGGCSEGVH